MSDEIDFYTNPVSRGRIVHWMLEEAGAKYRAHLLDLATGEQRKPEYLAINPMGKVPAIVHRGVVITEVGAICMYLAEAFPAARLAPTADDPLRGAYLRWMFFAAATLEPAFIDRVTERNAPTVRVGALSYGNAQSLTSTLLSALRRSPYLLGENFSAADLCVGAQMAFGMSVKVLEPHPEFTEYLARLVARPANQRFEQQSARWAEEMKARSQG